MLMLVALLSRLLAVIVGVESLDVALGTTLTFGPVW